MSNTNPLFTRQPDENLSQKPEHFPGLDILRAVAILLVFLFHYSRGNKFEPIRLVGEYGWIGVDLFFVLSGFLIASQVFEPLRRGLKFSLKSYFLKRSLRILPAYFFVLALYFGLPEFGDNAALPPLWKFLTFTQNFSLDTSITPAFSHAWSLCVEEQFYLIFPLLVLILSHTKNRALTLLIILILFALPFIARYFSYEEFISLLRDPKNTRSKTNIYLETIYYPTYNRIDPIVMGVLLALTKQYFNDVWLKLSSRPWLTGFAALLFFSISVYLLEKKFSQFSILFVFFTIGLSFACLLLTMVSLFKTSPRLVHAFSWLAGISYTTYLLHKPVIGLVHRYLVENHQSKHDAFAFYLSLALSLFAGWLLSVVIEKPGLRLRKKLLG